MLLELLERGVHGVVDRLVVADALGAELHLACNRLVLELVDGGLVAHRHADGEDVARRERRVGDEGVVGLLRHGYDHGLGGVLGVDVP